MKEIWIETRKGGDFAALGEQLGISPVTARVIRNRELTTREEMEEYLHGDISRLHSPHRMKDMDRAVEILCGKIASQKKLRIIGDYDVDGIHATYILYRGLKELGAVVDYAIPNRLSDGYGINLRLIRQAYADGTDTIVTCDNGIAAIGEIAAAKELGMTVIVTDHHDIPFEEKDGVRVYRKNPADAVINPKQPDCPYPYQGLCGAAVAFQLIQALKERLRPETVADMEFLENAAFATIGDVMDLTGENRILVKEGLKALHQTGNLGMQALIRQNGLEPEQIQPYHIGFVLGPCMNASGRLDTAEDALRLLLAEKEEEAAAAARHLIELNESRKAMTEQQLKAAVERIETEKLYQNKVMAVYLPECHESLAGIIAGRIRELYYRPVFVLTKGEDGIKGSGRSIEEYSMYEEMNRVADVFTRFGGHPMAAGLSMAAERLPEFARRINEACTLTEQDLTEKVRFDAVLPLDYVKLPLIEQLSMLEPFGKGNARPLFAERNVYIRSMRVLGARKNVVKLSLASGSCHEIRAVYFGDGEAFVAYLTERYGSSETAAALRGAGSSITISILYEMGIDTYQGAYEPQVVIRRYR